MKRSSALIILSVCGLFTTVLGDPVPQMQQPQQQQPIQYTQTVQPQWQPQQPIQQQPQQFQQIQPIQQQQQPIQQDQSGFASNQNIQIAQPIQDSATASGNLVETTGGAGGWEEASAVGHSAVSSGLATVSEMFVNLGLFQVLLIPAILLTGVYLLYVAYHSPYNAQSHYLVDSVTPAHGGFGGLGGLGGHGGGHGGGFGWKRSLNAYAAKYVEELTPKVMDALKNFASKYNQ